MSLFSSLKESQHCHMSTSNSKACLGGWLKHDKVWEIDINKDISSERSVQSRQKLEIRAYKESRIS